MEATVRWLRAWPTSALVFAGWTLLVWGGRARNLLSEDTLTGAALVVRWALAGFFLLAAVAVLISIAVSWRRSGPQHRLPPIGVAVFAFVTIVVWVFRSAAIITGSHTIGFVIVHTLLAGISSALAVWCLIVVRRLMNAEFNQLR